MKSDNQKVIVRQTKSSIGRTQRVKDTLCALGLGKIGKSQEFTLSPSVYGMLRKVKHLIEVRKV